MATLTPLQPGVVAAAPTTIVPTGGGTNDQILAAPYSFIILVIRTGATNTFLGTIDDPTSQNPGGTLVTAGDFDVSTGTVPISSTRVMRLDCGRFRDVAGNINIKTSSTPAGTTLEAYGF